MLKLAIVTPTCRTNPRLSEVARTLAAALRKAPEVTATWIIVDELGRDFMKLIGERYIDWPDGDRFSAIVCPPISSACRNGTEKLPAHNSARNSGLLEAARIVADYAMLLNDCNLVTPDWANVVKDCAEKGLGWSCKTHELPDMAVPDDGVVHSNDHFDLLRPIPHTSAPRQCWGAPMKYFVEVSGFDMAYDGQKRASDAECVTRMARLGLQFVSTERAFTVQLRRTKIDSEVSTNKAAQIGVQNKRRLNALLADKKRTQPERGVDLANPGRRYAEDGPSLSGTGITAQSQSPVALELVRQTGPGADASGDARSADDAAPPAVKIPPVVEPKICSHCGRNGRPMKKTKVGTLLCFDQRSCEEHKAATTVDVDLPLSPPVMPYVMSTTTAGEPGPEITAGPAVATTGAAAGPTIVIEAPVPAQTTTPSNGADPHVLAEGEIDELADEFDTGGAF